MSLSSSACSMFNIVPCLPLPSSSSCAMCVRLMAQHQSPVSCLTCCQPVFLATPENESPGVVVFGVLGWCPAWGPEEGPWPPAKRIVVPGGPWQYHAVQQYSVVRRSWRPGGVAIFLNRPASTPPRILIGVFLIPPVRCNILNLVNIVMSCYPDILIENIRHFDTLIIICPHHDALHSS